MDASARRRSSGPTLSRLLAVRVLERVERVRAYADIALHQALGQCNLSSADRALSTELVYGTLRWRGRIDWQLQRALDRPLAEIEPLILTTLRLGAYQILFADRIPDTAAVDQAVSCARAIGAERATGLVNAVLRRLAREHESISPPALADEPLAHLQHALSLPEWIAARWLADYGAEEAAAFARASNEAPPLTVRVNPLRTDRDRLLEHVRADFPDAHPCRIASRGIVLGRKGNPAEDPRFLAGDYTVQDESSQLVVELLDPQPGERILDACAAPGTKTTAIAEYLDGRGSVLALDRNGQRLNLIARGTRRLGLAGVRTLLRNAKASLRDLPDPEGGEVPTEGVLFDRALVDAPCSGLGTLRRNPDARWRVRPQDPGRLANVQSTLLDRVAEVVRPGGTLVYSTCTVLREENEDVIERFLENHADFRLAPRSELPQHLDEVLDERGLMHCYPHVHDRDGFFAARLERTE
jgi:16S rRNA (cytosine967-C5)-methyltransferase